MSQIGYIVFHEFACVDYLTWRAQTIGAQIVDADHCEIEEGTGHMCQLYFFFEVMPAHFDYVDIMLNMLGYY